MADRLPFKQRIAVCAKTLRALRQETHNLIVVTEHITFMRFEVGRIVIIYANSGHACRCRILDRCRYATLDELETSEMRSDLANKPPEDLPHYHVYIILRLELLPSIASLARAKASP